MIKLLLTCGWIWDSLWQLDHLIKKDSDAYLRQGHKKSLYLRRLRGLKKQLIKLL